MTGCNFLKALFNLRENVCKELSLDRKNVELSMGMSADYEDAVSLFSSLSNTTEIK